MDLATAPEWTAPAGASRLALLVAWASGDYTNEGSGSTPALPISINGLDVGNAITDNMDGTYTTRVALPSGAGGTATVGIEGHPAADLDGDATYSDRIAVVNAYDHINLESRGTATVRNDIIDIAKCNTCHDSAGQGISLHGNNRTGEMQVCAVCHNSDATDINRRPMDPTMTADGKVEEAIDMKRIIHQIHSGADLQNGIVIWGFGFPGTEHDFSDVNFIGNRANCETCHLPGTYGTEAARSRLATTISTGADPADPGDDLNISQTASVCSSCHDDDIAKDHMVLNGASFIATDADIR
jgi:OmcA/MtrC family decaheme c-type cytochrome